MANISAKMVGDLKKKTGAGLMDCKRALVETDGDVDAAIKLLREKGLAAAAKKADRIAADGLVSVLKDGNTVAMVEVNSETDFVAKNASFVEFVQGILRTVIAFKPATIEELKACKFDGTEYTVEETIKDKIYTIGENITLRRFVVVEGVTSTYIHGAGVPEEIWTADHDSFLRSMADAASSVVDYFEGRIVYVNVMKNMSVDCDCCAVAEDPCMADIGILMSLDPVAIDQACVDLVYASNDPGKGDLIERIESRHGSHTLEAAEKLGIGSREYELVGV